MERQQKGITFIGFMMVAVLVCAVALLLFRVFPAYIEHYNVTHALAALKSDTSVDLGTGDGAIEVRKALQRRFDLNEVRSLTSRDVLVTPAGSGYRVRAKYAVNIHLLSNIDLVISFDDEVTLTYASR